MYAESKPTREHLNLEENCLQAFDHHCALDDKSEGRYGLKSVANSGHIFLKAEVGSLHLPWPLSSWELTRPLVSSQAYLLSRAYNYSPLLLHH